MNEFQIILFVGVTLITILKAVALKPCAKLLPSSSLPFALGLCLFIATTLMLPFYYEKILFDLNVFKVGFILCIVKGFLLFFHLDLGQKLIKETASSRTMVGAISVGGIAFINYIFFGEKLTDNQMVSAIFIALFGLFYYLKGHLSETSIKAHIAFMGILITSISLSVLDHVILGYIGVHWFTLLFISNIIMLLTGVFLIKTEIPITKMIKNKILLLATFIFLVGEFYLMNIRATLLPVTLVNIATVMSVPFIMIFMSIKWEESTPQKQAFFGVVTCIIGVISFL